MDENFRSECIISHRELSLCMLSTCHSAGGRSRVIPGEPVPSIYVVSGLNPLLSPGTIFSDKTVSIPGPGPLGRLSLSTTIWGSIKPRYVATSMQLQGYTQLIKIPSFLRLRSTTNDRSYNCLYLTKTTTTVVLTWRLDRGLLDRAEVRSYM